MSKRKSILKILFINFLICASGLIALELVLRIKLNSEINISKPIKTIKSVSKAVLNNKSNWGHLDQSNLYRYPYPYLMFKGAPNKLDHNHLGFRISDPVDKSTINIALFGGSTGYRGTPPIINLITNELNRTQNYVKFTPINFSVVSSNHNQHLHSLVENYNHYPIDIIIFYGGYNETLQHAFYDPRPGYPYNFNKRNEVSPEKMLLIKHFALFKVYEKFFPSYSKKKVWTKEWSNDIVKNYISTIDKARGLSNHLTTGRCEIPFIFVYQPFNVEKEFVDKSFVDRVRNPLSKLTNKSNDGINLSKLFQNDKSYYTDIVHLIQKGRKVVSRNIINSKSFKKAISSCSLD